jgi:DNA-directed RNA polymerase specialized sigma24 family protein
MSKDDKDPPPREAAPRRVTREVLFAFLARPDVVKWTHEHVATLVPQDEGQQVAQQALLRALKAEGPPANDDPEVQDKLLWASLRTLVDRQIADFHDRRRTRKKYEGQMPTAPVQRDEAGEPIEGDDEAVADIDPSHDPRAEDRRVEGVLLKQYLARAVAGNARDEETLGWVLAWSDEDKSYQVIAKEAGVAPATVHTRVFEFRKKYLPRYRRFRDRTILVLLLLLLVVGLLLYLLWPPERHDIVPARDFTWPPPPSASASAAPAPVDSFNNALPRPPRQDLK